MLRAGVTIAVALAAASSRAEDVDPHAAQPERPTVATHAYTVAPGWIEIESGLELDRLSGLNTFSTPTSLKLGLAPRLQLEVTAAFIDSWGTADAQGMSDLVLGLKWRVAESIPVLGDLALEPALRFPTGLVSVGGDNTIASLLLISSNHFGPLELDVNFGVFARIAGTGAPPLATLWTVAGGLPVLGPLGWTLEVFGYPGTSGAAGTAPIVGLLTGPTWIVHPAFVLDTGVVFPLDGPQPHSLYAGLTWNIGRVW